MKYDFDKIIDRKNTDSLKYDFSKERGMPGDLLPLWVADMDFAAPPEVLEDLKKCIGHGIFGYTEVKEDYKETVADWFSEGFGYTIKGEEILKTPGMVFALAQVIRAFTKEGDGVIIQPPVYYPFFEIIEDNKRRLEANSLRYTGGRYEIDFEDFQTRAQKPDVKLFILCSPHNPVGRVWKKEELQRLYEICNANGVLVVADEIHCDFVWAGNTHTSYRLIDEEAIICTAPSKTFNIAGLQVTNLFIKNRELRRRLKEEINKAGYSQLNTLGLAACKSAYQKGGPWLFALKEYLQGNIAYLRDFLKGNLPKVKLIEPEGTYLLWLDFSAYGLPQEVLDGRIIHGAKLWLDGGTMFGSEGEGFERINVACPRETLRQALRALAREFKEEI